MQFKWMKRTFFHVYPLPLWTTRRSRPPLRDPIGIPYSGGSAKQHSGNQTPWAGIEEVRIDDPPQSASHDQRSKQFRPNTDGLSEPRVEWIGGGGHDTPTLDGRPWHKPGFT